MNTPIQGLWIGDALSVMEQLSIVSFLKFGHDYHLYVYDDVAQVPDGAVVKDGNEILPASMIFQYRDWPSFSGFSNYFRYKLLLDEGGWWADLDTICLKPLDFEDSYVIASERVMNKQHATTAFFKCPAASEEMAYAWQTCQQKNPQEINWGETGPRLMAAVVEKFSLQRYTRPPETFCPFACNEWDKVLDPHVAWAFDESTYAIHLWHEMWRRAGQPKDQPYHPDCIYEQLKRKYLS